MPSYTQNRIFRRNAPFALHRVADRTPSGAVDRLAPDRSLRLGGAIAALLLGAFFAVPAGATLIGDDVVIRRIAGAGPTVTDNAVVVGAGTELLLQGRHDVGASSITLDWDIAGLGGLGFDASNQIFEYRDLQEQGGGTPTVLTGVALSTNVTGLDASRLTFTDDSVSLDLTALSVLGPNPGGFSFVQVDLTFEAVPEPGTALLLGAGLAGLASRRSRRPARSR